MKKSDNTVKVEFIDDLFGAGGAKFAELIRGISGNGDPRIFLVADANVVQRHAGLGAAIGRWVNGNFLTLAGAPVLLPGGERVKSDNFQSVLTVAGAALDAQIGKNDIFLALGGGAVLDVAGYVAAQVRGGTRLVRVPTTALAMMDSSFATTAALDSENVKDALVVPSPAVLSVIDVAFATTVLDGVWWAAFAEALRTATVRDAKLVKKLAELAPAYKNRDLEALRAMVEAVVALRKKKDPTTFALWAAQRLQAMSSYKLPHGYAVAIALTLDLHVATISGFLSAGDRDFLLGAMAASGAGDALTHNKHLLGYAESLVHGLDAWQLVHGSRTIILPAGLGKAVLDENPDEGTIKAALNLLK